MSDAVLKVEGLYKKFCKSLKRSMLYGTHDIARSILGYSIDNAELRKKEFWALQDISFELKRGETLGLIGKNGCGKTTLLRLINGIFPPDRGRIKINGRIGALIAVGAGFHPYMTGIENIYLNGIILGMTKKEIDKKLEEIIDFAEIGDFINSPVSTYSSGMTVRLGFAIAIHCEPDVLLLDEILAVGDMRFQQKCFARIGLLLDNGTAIILVSHDMLNIQKICKTALMLENGRVLTIGKVQDVIGDCFSANSCRFYGLDAKVKEKNRSSYHITYKYLRMFNSKGEETRKFVSGEDITIEWTFELLEVLRDVSLHFGLQSDAFTYNGYSTYYDNILIEELSSNDIIRIGLKKVYLSAGDYHMAIGIWDKNFIGSYFWDYESPGHFKITNPNKMLGRFAFEHYWQINDKCLQK